VPRDRVVQTKATVIGVGAGGRNVALQLAYMGLPVIQVMDFDKVENHNIVTQGFFPDEVGMSKVDAVKNTIARIDPTIRVGVTDGRYQPGAAIGNAVFCCVDSIETRKQIWEAEKERILSTNGIWLDGRMRGETIIVYAVSTADAAEFYETKFFPESEAQVGACTARGTIYCANISAGLQVAQFVRWLRREANDYEQIFSLFAGELSVHP